MTQPTPLTGRRGSRRLTVAATWLGTAALVIGGATTATASTTEAPGPSPDSYVMAPEVAPQFGQQSADAVAGEYLVVLKGEAPQAPETNHDSVRLESAPDPEPSEGSEESEQSDQQADQSQEWAESAPEELGEVEPSEVKAAVTRGRDLGADVEQQFTESLPGYAAKLSESELAAIRSDPAVAYVQPNLTYRLSSTTQKKPPSWGLDRIDQRPLPLDKSYYSTATGKGVTAYIVDTGIALGHPDLKNARPGASVVDEGDGGEDCLGHGTHVAGTVGGTRYGVAKDVTLVPIRVFSCNEEATSADVVAGLDAVLAQEVTGPRVVNLSLGDGRIDGAVDNAVKRVIAAGVTVVIAAGNGDARGNGVSACSVSPAHVRAAITVGATTKKDARTAFSNYGSCVDVYAPGADIVSDYPADENGNWRLAIMSGTSMAAPHVTGAVAMYLERHPNATPAQVQAAIVGTASKNKVTNVSSKWPRSMLFALQKAIKPASVTGGNKLHNNESLVRGNKLCSTNGTYCLSIGSAGKLQLRKVKGANKRAVWSAGKDTVWTRMTSSGALSSYDAYGRRTWSSGKTGGQATLYVTGGGKLKILRDSDQKVLWTSKA